MRTMTRRAISASVLAACLLAGSSGVRAAEAQTVLRMTWYSDGNEGEVMADLLRRFEDKNRDIHVVLDQVPFKAINENLPVQLASGQGRTSPASATWAALPALCSTCAPT